MTTFLEKLKEYPNDVSFLETIAVIDENYDFTSTPFYNGTQHNEAGENSGSCKIFAFAQLQNLLQAETLTCFGSYYFVEVLENPEGVNHQNIRNFIKTGWLGIQFEGEALTLKA